MFDEDSQPNTLDKSQQGIDMGNRRVKRAESPIPKTKVPALRRKRRKGEIDLDSEDMLNLHNQLLSIYRRELDRQFENRMDQQIDEDFYDNIQWTEEDSTTLKDRGQMPLVYNVISTSVNWVTGTEKRSRMDFKILPRRKDDSKPAERKTALLKYLSDVNRSPFHRSRAFEDAVKVGVGWLECGVEDGDGGDPVYNRYESWRNMLWDSAATEKDLSDARYITRSKWVDTDILKAIFADRTGLINESIDHDNIYASGIEADGDQAMDSIEIENDQSGMMREPIDGFFRPRNRVMEVWFRRPVETYKMVGGLFAGDIYDFSDAHDHAIRSGQSRVVKKPTMRMYVAIFTARGFLYFGESPYRHNRFPFTPVWGYRRGRDGMPYGMIRGLRDIQADINKRASKALYILSSNKVIMDEDALPDSMSEDEFAVEVARPDAIIKKKKGSEMILNAERELAEAHLELMSRSIAMIQQQSGVTDELMGRHTNAVSGVAIQRRQDQGSTATTNLFDNLRFASQVHGEKQLSLVEQFYTEEKEFRITSMRGTPEYVTLNSGMPEDDITRTKADFIVSEADWHATMRQASAEALLESLKMLPPQVALVMVDLIVENLDLPNRDEIVKRIRSATGLPDPDAEGPTPEQIAAERMKMIQDQMNMAAMEADLATKQGNAAKARAQAILATRQAQKVLADIKQTLAAAVGLNAQAQSTAIDTAIKMISAEPAVPVADHLLNEAGFEGEPERKAKAAALAQALDEAQQVPAPPAAAQPAPQPVPSQAPGLG